MTRTTSVPAETRRLRIGSLTSSTEMIRALCGFRSGAAPGNWRRQSGKSRRRDRPKTWPNSKARFACIRLPIRTARQAGSRQNHPDVFWIYSARLFRGIWKEGDQAIVSPAWLKKNVLEGHGALGPLYPPKAAGKDGVKEGDTPSFLYVLSNGLSDPEHPQWGNWGGRFRASGYANEFIPADDIMEGKLNLLYSIHRWRTAYQNAFEARMDWCVKPYAQANHEPIAVCNEDTTRRVLEMETSPGAQVELSAHGSSDPDGDTLEYRWWVYREAGSYWADASIRSADKATAVLTVPKEASGRTIHVILEVTDTGQPPLVAYRRVVLQGQRRTDRTSGWHDWHRGRSVQADHRNEGPFDDDRDVDVLARRQYQWPIDRRSTATVGTGRTRLISSV